MRRNPSTTNDLVSGSYILTKDWMTTLRKSSGNFYNYDESDLSSSTTYSGSTSCVECSEPTTIINYAIVSNLKSFVVGYKNGKVFSGTIDNDSGPWVLLMTFT